MEYLLGLGRERRIDIALDGLSDHYRSPWASEELIRSCEKHLVVLKFAKTAVERQKAGKGRGI